jgi:hypothetical protein
MEDLSYFKNSRILDQCEHKQKSPLISEGFYSAFNIEYYLGAGAGAAGLGFG